MYYKNQQAISERSKNKHFKMLKEFNMMKIPKIFYQWHLEKFDKNKIK